MATIERQTAMGDDRGRMASERRLVQALQWLGEPAEAVQRAQAVVVRLQAQGPADGLHFALHHLGKALIQAGRPEDARQALTQAVALRMAMGDLSLVQSTHAALELVGGR